MPRKSTVPEFRSEAEEAAWYTTPQGRRQTEREFRKALKNGTIVGSKGSAVAPTDHAVLEQLMEQAKEKATKAISIRLPIGDIERASAIAQRRGVGYQTVLKELIKAGLSKAS